MRNKLTILKAFLLLVVFSLNTLLGFACSIGIDLGYNSNHHQAVSTAPKAATHHCEASTADQPKENPSPAPTHDCCKDGVVKFNLADKSVSSVVKLDAPDQAALTMAALYFIPAWHLQQVASNHYYVRSDHPPISRDLRIVIQSFQI
jgi:hypothetical protein